MKDIQQLGISHMPWLCDIGDSRVAVANSERLIYAKSMFDGENEFGKRMNDEKTANARLIAAAPDLYEAVVDLLEICGNIGEYIGIDCGTIEKIGNARKSLAKAAGEEVQK